MSVIPVNLTFGFVSRLKPDNYTQHNDTAETVNIQRPASQANTHTHTLRCSHTQTCLCCITAKQKSEVNTWNCSCSSPLTGCVCVCVFFDWDTVCVCVRVCVTSLCGCASCLPHVVSDVSVFSSPTALHIHGHRGQCSTKSVNRVTPAISKTLE